MRKKVVCFVLSGCLAFELIGCGNNERGPKFENKVESVIQAQIDEENGNAGLADVTAPPNGLLLSDESTSSDVDYDLTQMDSDMVYATVFQMMQNPSTYVGKTFRIEGLYASEYYEATNQTYSFIIIKDAMACCAQGMEFVWEDEDGVHDISEYPQADTDILIEGIFDTYKEKGDNTLYCHLRNASLQIL